MKKLKIPPITAQLHKSKKNCKKKRKNERFVWTIWESNPGPFPICKQPELDAKGKLYHSVKMLEP